MADPASEREAFAPRIPLFFCTRTYRSDQSDELGHKRTLSEKYLIVIISKFIKLIIMCRSVHASAINIITNQAIAAILL